MQKRLSIPEFVAIDFETNQYQSACAIGLVKYDSDGEVDSFNTLIKPHQSKSSFHEGSTRIHGITAEMVRDKPEWDDIYPQVQEFIGDLPLVAHNMSTDAGVLTAINELYGLEDMLNPKYCSLENAKTFLNLYEYKLPTVLRYLCGFQILNHHDALEDSRACAKVFRKLDTLVTPFVYGKRNYSNYLNSKQYTLADEVEACLNTITNSSILNGAFVVITGKPVYYDRQKDHYREILITVFMSLGATVQKT